MRIVWSLVTPVLAAALVVVMAGCAGTGVGGDDSGPPHRGGTLKYGLSLAPTCADPAQSSSNQTIYVTRQVVDSLTDQNPRTGQIVPWLAQSWQVDPTSREFTFRLRPGVTFSDGTPVDATAIKRTFDAIVTTLGGVKAPLPASYLAGYTGTTVVDPLTARVTFSAPNAQFLQASATPQLGILAASTNAESAETRCQSGIVGSGPFTYADYQQDRSAKLVRRTGYAWGSAAFGHAGETYLDAIQFTVVPESGVRTGSVSSGQLDAVSDALPQDAPLIENTGGVIRTTPNPGLTFGIQPNVSRGVLADPAVRRALIPAIDRQELVDTVLGKDFLPATGVLSVKTPGYQRSDAVTFDPERARSILQQAGWTPGPDGVRTKNGARLSFSILFSAVFAGNQTILELVQQQLRKVGVDARLDLVSLPESTSRQNSGDFDATYYNSTRGDGDILRTAFSVTQRNLNQQRVPNAALEQAFVGELSTTDVAARNRFFAQAQQQILDNGLWIPTVELSQAIGVGPRAHAVTFDASARLQFYDTWVNGG
ncbi:ABC transporter substrate-binding protein [Williamsia herbipolensis]|uniref:ABC transporter substrate-binding protein n=1 Tax=Williamsia herbipolensis TaxID=1603258 RepID=UPI0005F8497D